MSKLNLTDMCRACGAWGSCMTHKPGMTSIFTKTLNPPIDVMLKAIASLNPQPDDCLPPHICKICLEQVEQSYAFRQQVIHTDNWFRMALTKGGCDNESIKEDMLISGSKRDLKEQNEELLNKEYVKCAKLLDEDVESLHKQLSPVSIKTEVIDLQDDDETSLSELNVNDEEDTFQVDKNDYLTNSNKNHSKKHDTCQLSRHIRKDQLHNNKTKTMNCYNKEPSVADTSSMLICSTCAKTFNTFQLLECHQLNYHPLIVECPKCLDVFNNTSSMERHLESHKPGGEMWEISMCHKCGQHYRSMHAIKSHTCNILLDSEECLICAQRVADQEKLCKHFLDCAMGLTELNCKLCARVFVSKMEFFIHTRWHFGIKLHICKYCKEVFMIKQDWIDHVSLHEKLTQTCVQCGSAFEREVEYDYNHCADDFGETDTFEDTIDEDEVDDLLNPLNLKDEETCNNLTSETNGKTRVNKRIFQCKLCNFTCTDHIKRHLSAHLKENPYVCLKCKRTFARDDEVNLDSHKNPNDCVKNKITLSDFKDQNRLTLYYTEKVLYEESDMSLPLTKNKDGGQEAKCEVTINNSNEYIEQVTVEVDMPHLLREEDKLFSSEIDEDDPEYRPNVKVGQKKKKKSSRRGPGRPKKIKTDAPSTAPSPNEKEGKQSEKKIFLCNLCDFTSTIHNNLIQHERTCIVKRVIMCEACNKRFDLESELENHLTTQIEAEKCQGLKRSKTITHEDYSDPVRLSEFNTETVYFLGENNQTEGNTQRNNDKEDLLIPIKSESYDYEEDMCQSPSTKVLHAREKNKDGLPMETQVAEVDDDEPETDGNYQCPVCNEAFECLTDFEAHGKEVHADYQILKCPKCVAMFSRVYALKRHMRLHRIEAGERVDADKIHPCGRCQKRYSSVSALKFHMRKHEAGDSFVCSICSKSFMSKSDLLEHKKFHAREKKFVCSVCGFGFIRNSNLVMHMKRHRGDKPYACKFCGKAFARQTDVKAHEPYHTGEKSHFCTVCGRGFAKAYTLDVHMRTHTGEKPFQCQYCDLSFAQRNTLIAHERRHTGERFQCDLCPSNFIMGHELIRHKRKNHGLNIVSERRRLKDSDAQQSEEPELPKTVVAPI